MLRNVKLKKFLVQNVFPVFSFINKCVPKREACILIYCANDRLRDNAAAIYDYLIENEYYHKYKIICCVQSHRNYKKHQTKKVKFMPKHVGILLYMISGHVFYSEGKIPVKPTKKQMVVNMWHGIPVKRIGKLSNINNGDEFFFTYVCAPSELYRPIMAKAFGCPEENVCICGEPKTDKLYVQKARKSSTKLIIWAPTFRQSAYLGYSDSHMSSLLPFVENSQWNELNTYLKNKNIKLVVKLHATQDLNGFTEKIFTNLEIYGDAAFRSHGYDLYEFMAQSDALIADYSSVYLHYLLLNRPIGFALSDLDEYRDTRGFVFENPLDYMPGEKLYSKEDLFEFLDDVAAGKDGYAEERERVCNLVHQYQDGKNTERLLKIAGITK